MNSVSRDINKELHDGEKHLLLINGYYSQLIKANQNNDRFTSKYCYNLIENAVKAAVEDGYPIDYDVKEKQYRLCERYPHLEDESENVKNCRKEAMYEIELRITEEMRKKEQELNRQKDIFYSKNYSFLSFKNDMAGTMAKINDALKIMRDLELEIDILIDMREALFVEDNFTVQKGE